jgi:hypothetical protein
MYITKLNTFAEVASHYENVKRLVSKSHPEEHDVRPLGDRRRKWERIIKISDDCYAFSCGGAHDPVFTWGTGSHREKDFPLLPEDTARLAPVVWRRDKDGVETVTVRNGVGNWSHQSVYGFIRRTLPMGLRFFQGNKDGRQFVRCASGDIYLPKTMSVPRHVYEEYKADANRSSHWAQARLKATTPDDDNLSVTFKRTEAVGFEVVGTPPPEYINRIRVNREDKAAFKPHIEQLWSWAIAVYPLMQGQLNWSFVNDTNKEMNRLANLHKIDGYKTAFSNGALSGCDVNLVRAILADPDHVLRYGLGIAALSAIHEVAGSSFYKANNRDLSPEDFEKQQRKDVRAKFNSFINKMCRFSTTMKEVK